VTVEIEIEIGIKTNCKRFDSDLDPEWQEYTALQEFDSSATMSCPQGFYAGDY